MTAASTEKGKGEVMKGKKMKTIFVVVCLIIIVAAIISLLPSGKDETADTNEESGTVSAEPSAEPTAEPEAESTEPSEEVKHRSGDEIIGISEKDISDLHLVYYDSVIDDVTGKWRLSVMSEDIDIQDYIYSYYQQYFKADNEVHGIVNLASKTTTRINYAAGMLTVTEYDYVDGEEHDAKLLYSGTPIKSYIVYADNGDIEKIDE